MTQDKEPKYNRAVDEYFAKEAKKQIDSLLPIAKHSIKYYPGEEIDHFFQRCLDFYYSPLEEGMSGNVGHILYRLSDYLPLEKRQKIVIYPSDTGSIIQDGEPWDTLQDWRKDWENRYPYIPYFPISTKRLSGEIILALQSGAKDQDTRKIIRRKLTSPAWERSRNRSRRPS